MSNKIYKSGSRGDFLKDFFNASVNCSPASNPGTVTQENEKNCRYSEQKNDSTRENRAENSYHAAGVLTVEIQVTVPEEIHREYEELNARRDAILEELLVIETRAKVLRTLAMDKIDLSTIGDDIHRKKIQMLIK